MADPTDRRRLLVSVMLLGFGLAVCGWQVEEHVRFRRNAEQNEQTRSDLTVYPAVDCHTGGRNTLEDCSHGKGRSEVLVKLSRAPYRKLQGGAAATQVGLLHNSRPLVFPGRKMKRR